MKLILSNRFMSDEVDLEDAEIIITDKKNPGRSYKFTALGGWILIRKSENTKNYAVEMKTSITIINMESNFSDEITNYRG